jgi:predicted dehydrogenase
MATLRFALFGTGFWSRFQLAAWKELPEVGCVALYNRTPEKAIDLAKHLQLNIPVYDDPRELLRCEAVDFLDIVTGAEKHRELVHLAAAHSLPVICQKPMATSYDEAEEMVEVCRRAHVPFLIHENWRWQTPIRKLKELLVSGVVGNPYRARLRMTSGFPVFDNQPFLREVEKFLLVDIGSHILDVCRFLFGEPKSLYCSAQTVQPGIKGEDVGTVILRFPSGVTVVCEMGYTGAPLETDCFPQTFALVEGDRGSIELAPDYLLRVTTGEGTSVIHAPPPRFTWADPLYEVVHASIVPCHADLLAGLRGERTPETTGEDNLRTVRLVFDAYESARRNEVIWCERFAAMQGSEQVLPGREGSFSG